MDAWTGRQIQPKLTKKVQRKHHEFWLMTGVVQCDSDDIYHYTL